MAEGYRLWFWAMAWSHLVLAIIAVGLALFTVIDTAWDYRLVRRLGVNGIYLAMTTGSLIRSLATLVLTLLIGFSSLVRVAAGLSYPYTSAAMIGFVIVLLLILQTSSDWIIRRKVMTIMQLQFLPPSDLT